MRAAAGSEAVKIRYSSNVLPVIVTGADETSKAGLSSLFGWRCVTVATDKELVSEDTVAAAFDNLKKFYKNKDNSSKTKEKEDD